MQPEAVTESIALGKLCIAVRIRLRAMAQDRRPTLHRTELLVQMSVRQFAVVWMRRCLQMSQMRANRVADQC
jgi:hypothetical protein